jgi:hypothetical protein
MSEKHIPTVNALANDTFEARCALQFMTAAFREMACGTDASFDPRELEGMFAILDWITKSIESVLAIDGEAEEGGQAKG